jgi:hypothetical protein
LQEKDVGSSIIIVLAFDRINPGKKAAPGFWMVSISTTRFHATEKVV